MYSISYYQDSTFKYVDSKTYPTASSALVRATLHINAHPDNINGAAIVYQGKKVQKRVRTMQLWNHEPKHV